MSCQQFLFPKDLALTNLAVSERTTANHIVACDANLGMVFVGADKVPLNVYVTDLINSSSSQIALVNRTVQNILGNNTSANLTVLPSDIQVQQNIAVLGTTSIFQVETSGVYSVTMTVTETISSPSVGPDHFQFLANGVPFFDFVTQTQAPTGNTNTFTSTTYLMLTNNQTLDIQFYNQSPGQTSVDVSYVAIAIRLIQST